MDAYRFPFLCPAHPYTHDFHVRRDTALQQSDDIDSIYYDISANNILKICMDDSHGHPVGAGSIIEEAYRRNYADTKAAMCETAGRYIPMGTEMMNETMLDLIDYYQTRAGGSRRRRSKDGRSGSCSKQVRPISSRCSLTYITSTAR